MRAYHGKEDAIDPGPLKQSFKKPLRWSDALIVLLALAGTASIFFVVSWINGLHGVVGLDRWFLPYATFLLFLRVLGFILLPLAVACVLLREARPPRRRPLSHRILLFAVVCMLALGLILPAGLYAGINYCGTYDAGDKPPVLLLSDVNGRYGVPDLCLSFWTRDDTCNTLIWGKDGTGNLVEEAEASRQHSFMLRDLEPACEYRYSLNGGEEVAFRTPSANPETLRFAVASDPHFGGNGGRSDLASSLFRQMGDPSHAYDYLFLLGDLVHLGFWDPSWREFLETVNATAPGLPLRTVMGNHDGIFTGFEKYYDYLYPDGMSNRSGSRLWQRVDINGIHLFFLDLEWGTECWSAEQQAWFSEQLAGIPAEDWTVVMQHTFYYVSDHFDNGDPFYVNADTRDALVPIFEEYDVDLVLSGHNHRLELLQRNGVTYAITAALGGEMREVGEWRASESVWVADRVSGYLEVAIEGDSAVLTFRDRLYRELYTASIPR